MNPNQYGFRKGLGTGAALSVVKNQIINNFAYNFITCLISLDISNAFNSVRINSILEIIDNYHPQTDLNTSLSQNRKVIIDLDDQFSYNIGISQGSSLGPILWLLNINELLDEFNFYNEYKLIAFADNILVILRAKASYHFTDLSSDPLKIISEWVDKHSLKFNLNKSNFTMIKKGKNITHIPTIKFQNGKFAYKKEIKYLGLIFDCNFSWTPHLNYLKNKVIKPNKKLKNICRAPWGLKPVIIKEIYLRVYEKIIIYGCDIWVYDTVRIRNKILQLQRSPLLGITKCYRTVATITVSVSWMLSFRFKGGIRK